MLTKVSATYMHPSIRRIVERAITASLDCELRIANYEFRPAEIVLIGPLDIEDSAGEP